MEQCPCLPGLNVKLSVLPSSVTWTFRKIFSICVVICTISAVPGESPPPTSRAAAQIYIFTLYTGPKITHDQIYLGPKLTHHQIYPRPKFTQHQIYPQPKFTQKFTQHQICTDPNLHKNQIYTDPKLTQTQFYTKATSTHERDQWNLYTHEK